VAGSKEREREARWRASVYEFVTANLHLPTSVYLGVLVARAMRHKNAYVREKFRFDLYREHIRLLMETHGIDEALGSRSAYAKLAQASTKMPEGDKGWSRFLQVIEDLGAHEAFRLFGVTAQSETVVVHSLVFTLRDELYTELDEDARKRVRDAIGNKRSLTIEEPPQGFLEGRSLSERRRST